MTPGLFSDNFLFYQDEFLVIAIVLVLLLIAAEFGFRRGRAVAPSHEGAAKAQHNTLQAATMGLMALVLAFTFSMAASRFETRKQLIVDESNAIATVYLRTRLLPEPRQSDTIKLLRSYVEARMRCYATALDEAHLDAASDMVRGLQYKLWSQALGAAASDPHSLPVGLFISALNDAFDAAARRDAARDNHVPDVVLYLLFLMALLTIGSLGFGCGLSTERHLFTTTALCLVVTLVIFVILDLDRPRRGLITVSRQRMIQLHSNIR
jgi:hypothetical protein